MIHPQFNFGLPQLLPEWRKLFSKQYLMADLLAGTAVACVAIPLSLAIALASGVPPEVGLATSIVAGIVCALFGGVPLAVSGPAAAMAVLIAAAAHEFGMSGIIFICFGCGFLQLLTGVLGLGSLVRFIPVPVVMGFTAGIGAIILIGQFPRILGLPAPAEGHIFSVIMHIKNLMHQSNPNAFILAIATLALTMTLPRLWPRLPSPLIAVVVPALCAYYLNLHVDLIGNIPSMLPAPHLPKVPSGDTIKWVELLSTTFIVYALASLETLLSAGAVDQLAKAKPHNPNQELIGQGLGNICSSLFSGIPATAVIARSALNVQAGGKTRRAAIFHSLFILATIYLLSPIISQIPIAVLAGLLIAIALRMCHPHELISLWHSSRSDAVVYLITFFMIVILGLLSGIQVGIVVALIFSIIRLGQINIYFYTSDYGPAQLELSGPLTFLSAAKVDSYQKKLADLDLPNGLIINLLRLRSLDTSGAQHLINLVEQLKADKVKTVLHISDPEYIKILTSVSKNAAALIANTDTEMEKILGIQSKHQQLTEDRLIYGIEKFKKSLRPNYKTIFSSLATTQQPHTLFITCSDSRIDPNLITSTKPGELFIVRNVGNIIPPFGKDDTPAEGAALEYALGVLNVKQIIVCAHSECGAIGQILSGDIFTPENKKRYPSVARWLSIISKIKDHFPKDVSSESAAKLNASLQLNNIKTYPIVQEKLAKNELKLQALYYDIGHADVEIWDEVLGRYLVVGENMQNLIFGSNQLRGLKLR